MSNIHHCPSREQWAELLASNEPNPAQAEMLDHLNSCAACRATLEQLAAGNWSSEQIAEHLLAGERQAFAAPEALAQVIRQLHDQPAPPVVAESRGEVSPDLPPGFFAPTSTPDQLGLLDTFEVYEEVGRGTMGVVLRAFDPKLQRIVAIKVMSPLLASYPLARQRFIREGHSAAAVCHENVVAVYGVGERMGLPYLVMQFIGGKTLQQRLDQTGALQVAEILRIGVQAAAGLAAAHAQGLVHRDIKPANLLLENGVERVKLTDFGLARAVDDASLTQTGVITGTPQYMSPEQARGESIDARSDLFSLGGVLYALCTGRPPFRGSSSLAVLKRVCDTAPTPIRELNPDIPDWLAGMVMRLLEKTPERRWQSARELSQFLIQSLEHWQHPGRVPLPPSAQTLMGGIEKPPTQPDVALARVPRPWWRSLRGILVLIAACASPLTFVLLNRQIDRWWGPKPPIQDERRSEQPTVQARQSASAEVIAALDRVVDQARQQHNTMEARHERGEVSWAEVTNAEVDVAKAELRRARAADDTASAGQLLAKIVALRLRQAEIATHLKMAGRASSQAVHDADRLLAESQVELFEAAGSAANLQLVGVWKMLEENKGGELVPEEKVANRKLVISNDAIIFTLDGPDFTIYRYRVTSSNAQAQIELVPQDGKDTAQPLSGIYSLYQDRLRICLGEDGQTPQDFVPTASSQQVVYVLERVR